MAKLQKHKADTPLNPKFQSQTTATKNRDKNKTKDKESKKAEVVVVKEAPPPAEPSDKDEEDAEEEGAEDALNDIDEDEDESGSDEDEDEEEDSEDEGVDQEGMERLMKLLGEDGLDDFDRVQLEGLVGGEEDSEDEADVGDEGEEVSEEEEDHDDGSDGEEEDEDLANSDQEGAEGEEKEEEAIPLDEVDEIEDDAVPQQKLEIDNQVRITIYSTPSVMLTQGLHIERQVALERIRRTIQLDPSLPWTETLSLTYPEKIEVDVNDDLNRELAFYKQALHSAQAARTLAAKHNFPFTRPSDYFAEMVKSDAHMERIRQRLLNESASIKKGEEKRKEREGKKFGKQVQIEKLKEREKSKKDMEERLKNLKRKRKDMLDNAQGGDDDFDIALEDAISDRPSKRGKTSDGSNKKTRMPRSARDKKFGFGGAGRRSKQNTKDSTDNFGPGAGRGKKGPGGKGGGKKQKQRPGKSRRMAARSKS